MNANVEIRPATGGDLPALPMLVEQYWRFENIDGFGTLLETITDHLN